MFCRLLLSSFNILIYFYLPASDTREYIVSGSDTSEIESFELANKNKFSSFAVKGSWTDNFGNYGKNKCMGIINKNLKSVELYFMCERIDKNGYKIWSLNKRTSSLQESGIGTYEIVDATIPKRNLFIGKKCTYAVKYLEETNFYKSKCKINEELANVLEKLGMEN